MSLELYSSGDGAISRMYPFNSPEAGLSQADRRLLTQKVKKLRPSVQELRKRVVLDPTSRSTRKSYTAHSSRLNFLKFTSRASMAIVLENNVVKIRRRPFLASPLSCGLPGAAHHTSKKDYVAMIDFYENILSVLPWTTLQLCNVYQLIATRILEEYHDMSQQQWEHYFLHNSRETSQNLSSISNIELKHVSNSDDSMHYFDNNTENTELAALAASFFSKRGLALAVANASKSISQPKVSTDVQSLSSSALFSHIYTFIRPLLPRHLPLEKPPLRSVTHIQHLVGTLLGVSKSTFDNASQFDTTHYQPTALPSNVIAHSPSGPIQPRSWLVVAEQTDFESKLQRHVASIAPKKSNDTEKLTPTNDFPTSDYLTARDTFMQQIISTGSASLPPFDHTNSTTKAAAADPVFLTIDSPDMLCPVCIGACSCGNYELWEEQAILNKIADEDLFSTVDDQWASTSHVSETSSFQSPQPPSYNRSLHNLLDPATSHSALRCHPHWTTTSVNTLPGHNNTNEEKEDIYQEEEKQQHQPQFASTLPSVCLFSLPASSPIGFLDNMTHFSLHHAPIPEYTSHPEAQGTPSRFPVKSSQSFPFSPSLSSESSPILPPVTFQPSDQFLMDDNCPDSSRFSTTSLTLPSRIVPLTLDQLIYHQRELESNHHGLTLPLFHRFVRPITLVSKIVHYLHSLHSNVLRIALPPVSSQSIVAPLVDLNRSHVLTQSHFSTGLVVYDRIIHELQYDYLPVQNLTLSSDTYHTTTTTQRSHRPSRSGHHDLSHSIAEIASSSSLSPLTPPSLESLLTPAAFVALTSVAPNVSSVFQHGGLGAAYHYAMKSCIHFKLKRCVGHLSTTTSGTPLSVAISRHHQNAYLEQFLEGIISSCLMLSGEELDTLSLTTNNNTISTIKYQQQAPQYEPLNKDQTIDKVSETKNALTSHLNRPITLLRAGIAAIRQNRPWALEPYLAQILTSSDQQESIPDHSRPPTNKSIATSSGSLSHASTPINIDPAECIPLAPFLAPLARMFKQANASMETWIRSSEREVIRFINSLFHYNKSLFTANDFELSPLPSRHISTSQFNSYLHTSSVITTPGNTHDKNDTSIKPHDNNNNNTNNNDNKTTDSLTNHTSPHMTKSSTRSPSLQQPLNDKEFPSIPQFSNWYEVFTHNIRSLTSKNVYHYTVYAGQRELQSHSAITLYDTTKSLLSDCSSSNIPDHLDDTMEDVEMDTTSHISSKTSSLPTPSSLFIQQKPQQQQQHHPTSRKITFLPPLFAQFWHISRNQLAMPSFAVSIDKFLATIAPSVSKSLEVLNFPVVSTAGTITPRSLLSVALQRGELYRSLYQATSSQHHQHQQHHLSPPEIATLPILPPSVSYCLYMTLATHVNMGLIASPWPCQTSSFSHLTAPYLLTPGTTTNSTTYTSLPTLPPPPITMGMVPATQRDATAAAATAGTTGQHHTNAMDENNAAAAAIGSTSTSGGGVAQPASTSASTCTVYSTPHLDDKFFALQSVSSPSLQLSLPLGFTPPSPFAQLSTLLTSIQVDRRALAHRIAMISYGPRSLLVALSNSTAAASQKMGDTAPPPNPTLLPLVNSATYLSHAHVSSLSALYYRQWIDPLTLYYAYTQGVYSLRRAQSPDLATYAPCLELIARPNTAYVPSLLDTDADASNIDENNKISKMLTTLPLRFSRWKPLPVLISAFLYYSSPSAQSSSSSSSKTTNLHSSSLIPPKTLNSLHSLGVSLAPSLEPPVQGSTRYTIPRGLFALLLARLVQIYPTVAVSVDVVDARNNASKNAQDDSNNPPQIDDSLREEVDANNTTKLSATNSSSLATASPSSMKGQSQHEKDSTLADSSNTLSKLPKSTIDQSIAAQPHPSNSSRSLSRQNEQQSASQDSTAKQQQSQQHPQQPTDEATLLLSSHSIASAMQHRQSPQKHHHQQQTDHGSDTTAQLRHDSRSSDAAATAAAAASTSATAAAGASNASTSSLKPAPAATATTTSATSNHRSTEGSSTQNAANQTSSSSLSASLNTHPSPQLIQAVQAAANVVITPSSPLVVTAGYVLSSSFYNSVPPVESPEFAKLFRVTRRTKKEMQFVLNNYEKLWWRTAGRKIRYQSDVEPVKKEWDRYRRLKAQLTYLTQLQADAMKSDDQQPTTEHTSSHHHRHSTPRE